MIDSIERIYSIAGEPFNQAKNYVNQSRKRSIGYFCSYFPPELIHAAGLIPIRIWGITEPSARINAHLQVYCCNMVKSILDTQLNGQCAFLHGAIFSHSCDSMQCLSDIWELNSTDLFHDTFNMPLRLDSSVVLKYTVTELQRLKQRIEQFSGVQVTDTLLTNSILLYNKSRRLLQQLYALRSQQPGFLPNHFYRDLALVAGIVPVEQLIDLVTDILNRLKSTEYKESAVPRLVMSGSVAADPAFYRLLDELRITVVEDDLCNGRRFIERIVDENEPPLIALAKSLINKSICPCKYSPENKRIDLLNSRIRTSNADGVLFYLHKFCEPHFFDYPYLKSKLTVPTILIEIEKPGFNIGQFRSRLEAFVEMIDSK